MKMFARAALACCLLTATAVQADTAELTRQREQFPAVWELAKRDPKIAPRNVAAVEYFLVIARFSQTPR